MLGKSSRKGSAIIFAQVVLTGRKARTSKAPRLTTKPVKSAQRFGKPRPQDGGLRGMITNKCLYFEDLSFLFVILE